MKGHTEDGMVLPVLHNESEAVFVTYLARLVRSVEES